MRRALALFLPAVLAVSAVAACGGGSDGGDPTPTGGPAVGDRDYMTIICRGTTNYLVALNSNPDLAAISEVVADWRDEVQGVTPPEDLRSWQGEFLQYLEEVVQEPTKGVSQSPPLPPEDARKRLVSHVPEISECQYRTFLEPAS